MSQENVEVIKRVLAAGNSGDFETVLALHHRDWEGFIPQEYPVAGTWRGLDGVRGFVEEWLEAWDEFRVEPDEFIHADDAVVVAVR
jgi:ketosteroid isomerase-like protein